MFFFHELNFLSELPKNHPKIEVSDEFDGHPYVLILSFLNIYITNWKDPPFCRWENPRFQMGQKKTLEDLGTVAI